MNDLFDNEMYYKCRGCKYYTKATDYCSSTSIRQPVVNGIRTCLNFEKLENGEKIEYLPEPIEKKED